MACYRDSFTFFFTLPTGQLIFDFHLIPESLDQLGNYYFTYRVAQKSVKRLVKCTLKYIRMSSILIELKKIFRNEILHVELTTHNAVL
jgi:hypothetical protein